MNKIILALIALFTISNLSAKVHYPQNAVVLDDQQELLRSITTFKNIEQAKHSYFLKFTDEQLKSVIKECSKHPYEDESVLARSLRSRHQLLSQYCEDLALITEAQKRKLDYPEELKTSIFVDGKKILIKSLDLVLGEECNSDPETLSYIINALSVLVKVGDKEEIAFYLKLANKKAKELKSESYRIPRIDVKKNKLLLLKDFTNNLKGLNTSMMPGSEKRDLRPFPVPVTPDPISPQN